MASPRAAGRLLLGLSPDGPRGGRAEMVPLKAVDTGGGKPSRLFRRFHRLCHREHVELPGDQHQRLGQHLIVGIMANTPDELTVYLDDIKGKLPKMPKGGEPGSEIVESKGDPAPMQVVHEGHDDFRHQHGGAFRDLEDQPIGNCPFGHQAIAQDLVPARVADGPRGHVDRYPHCWLTPQRGQTKLKRCAVDQPPQVRVFCDRHEVARGDRPSIFIKYADQALVKGDSAGFPSDDHRLVGQRQPALAQRSAHHVGRTALLFCHSEAEWTLRRAPRVPSVCPAPRHADLRFAWSRQAAIWAVKKW